MSSIRRGHGGGSRRSHVSSPTGSTSSTGQQDPEARPTAAAKFDSPSEEEEEHVAR